MRPTDDEDLRSLSPIAGYVLVLEFRVPADLQATSGEFTLLISRNW
ncbi:MAG: hypothetical protein R3B91_18195 [Planctomycetaceae bacterium]